MNNEERIPTSFPDYTPPFPLWPGGAVTPRAFGERADNVSPLTITGTNTWILHEPDMRKALIVDPGPDDEGHRRALFADCASLDCEIGAIALTHDHLDHIEGVAALAKAAGDVPVYYRSKRNLPTGRFAPFRNCPRIEVIPVPGHSSDSVAFLLIDDKALLTGDLLFRDWSSVITFPDGDLAAYFDSLDKLDALANDGLVEWLLPGHGYPIEDPKMLISFNRIHRMQRLTQIRDAIKQVGTDPDRVVEYVYPEVTGILRIAAMDSTKAQLYYLENENS